MEAPNGDGLNWDKALHEYGEEYLIKIFDKAAQSSFSGDWKHLCSFFKQLENNEGKPIDECQKSWIKWKGEYESKRNDISLNGINLSNLELRGINFYYMKLKDIQFINSYIEGSYFSGCEIDGASFYDARIIDTDFSHSTLKNIEFGKGYIQDCKFVQTKLEGVNFNSVNCGNLDFRDANFKEVEFMFLFLFTISFLNSRFEVSRFYDINFVKVNFFNCYFDEYCELSKCTLDKDFKIKNSNYSHTIFEDALISQFDYCNRRTNWEHYYEETGRLKALLIKIFWNSSDYGYSTTRPIALFFISSFIFSLLYLIPGIFSSSWTDNTGFISNLLIYEKGLHTLPLLVIRSLYFSIITMTTLGFGDIFANANSITGHILLTVQVLLGYFTLAIIITRLSTLFSQRGPTVRPKKRKFIKSRKAKRSS